MIRTVEVLEESSEVVKRQLVSSTQLRGESKKFLASVCELKELGVLDSRREVETLCRAVWTERLVRAVDDHTRRAQIGSWTSRKKAFSRGTRICADAESLN